MKKFIRLSIVIPLIVSIVGCTNSKEAASSNEPVSIINKGSHFEVVLDFTTGKSHFDMGKAYGAAILEAIPEYEALLDSYLAETTKNNQELDYLIARVNDIKPQIDPDYVDEIEGIASSFSGLTGNIRGDGKLSADELFLVNLFPDVVRSTQCAALSVFGQSSETQETMTARILEWYSGELTLARIHAVVTYKNAAKSIATVGYLGYMGTLSGFNDDRVFGAILDSATGAAYSSSSKYSYPMDLRYALEHYQTMDEVADFLKSPDRGYTFGHLIFLSDPAESKVLENNVATRANSIRAVRTAQSELNEQVVWDIPDSIGTVNSFQLKGNPDNHTHSTSNTARFESMKQELTSKGAEVTLDELKSVATYYTGEAPGEQMMGDLYTNGTQQIIIFEPGKLNLEVFFRPANALLPTDPEFEKITVDF